MLVVFFYFLGVETLIYVEFVESFMFLNCI